LRILEGNVVRLRDSQARYHKSDLMARLMICASWRFFDACRACDRKDSYSNCWYDRQREVCYPLPKKILRTQNLRV